MAINLLDRRIRMMPGFVQTFAGIPVLMDGCYFTKYNAARTARLESNPDYFIASFPVSAVSMHRRSWNRYRILLRLRRE